MRITKLVILTSYTTITLELTMKRRNLDLSYHKVIQVDCERSECGDHSGKVQGCSSPCINPGLSRQPNRPRWQVLGHHRSTVGRIVARRTEYRSSNYDRPLSIQCTCREPGPCTAEIPSICFGTCEESPNATDRVKWPNNRGQEPT